MNPRTQLPAASALAVLMVGAWSYVLLAPVSGVRVANHSGDILRNVQVCVQGGACLNRARLLPHESWRVATPGERTCVEVRVPGEGARQACVNAEDRPGVRLVVTRQSGIQTQE